jgi:hypothetical protein
MAGAIAVALFLGALAVHQSPSPAVVDELVAFREHIAHRPPPDPAALRDEAPRLVRVKPADAEMRRLVLAGLARSATFRALVDEIHRTNVVVVIQFGQCARGRVRSCVSHVAGDRRQRHIRIKLDTGATTNGLIATIAHELHHALEIAREPDVTNSELALALYRRIAIGGCGEGLSERCETEAALRIEARVNEELARGLRSR